MESVTSVPGFPYFYAIPVSGVVREVSSTASMPAAPVSPTLTNIPRSQSRDCTSSVPPPYSPFPLPSQPRRASTLPFAMESPDDTSQIRFRNSAELHRHRTMLERIGHPQQPSQPRAGGRQKIRYPSMPIGRWAQEDITFPGSTPAGPFEFSLTEVTPSPVELEAAEQMVLDIDAIAMEQYHLKTAQMISKCLNEKSWIDMEPDFPSSSAFIHPALRDREPVYREVEPTNRAALHMSASMETAVQNMTEEEKVQAGLIESIFMMLHKLQPQQAAEVSRVTTPGAPASAISESMRQKIARHASKVLYKPASRRIHA